MQISVTTDGGPEGSIEDESFSADGMKVTIDGLSAHPGYAKGKNGECYKNGSFVSRLLYPRKPNTRDDCAPRRLYTSLFNRRCFRESKCRFYYRDHKTSKLSEYEDLIG